VGIKWQAKCWEIKLGIQTFGWRMVGDKLEGNVSVVIHSLILANVSYKYMYLAISITAAVVLSLCTRPDRRSKNDSISVSLRV